MHETSSPRVGVASLCLQFATVSVASLVATAVWWLRSEWVAPAFLFMFWNLFLAWVPWALSLVVVASRRAWLGASFGAAWLIFFPNAPYVVTDFIHYRIRPGTPPWLDLMLFASFGLAGCVLGWASLRNVHDALLRQLSRARAGGVMCSAVLLSGLGVYLGRFERWNSWDLVTAPGDVVVDLLRALVSPSALAFSAVFAAFIGAGYLATQSIALPQRE